MTENCEAWQPIGHAEAVAMGWQAPGNELGSVTPAFEEWLYVDRDQRTWTEQTLSWAQRRYDEEWKRISQSTGYPDGPDPVDMLFDSLGSLMPHEHEWMTLAATIRDAVSAYEVYLSKAFDDVLKHHGLARPQRLQTTAWKQLQEFAVILGVDIKPPGVATVTDLRNILTHQRGELRHERERLLHGAAEGYTSHQAVLTMDKTHAHLDELGRATRAVDPLAWAYSWGGLRIPRLRASEASNIEG